MQNKESNVKAGAIFKQIEAPGLSLKQEMPVEKFCY